MIEFFTMLAATFGTGYLSAVFPLVNAEAAAAVAAGVGRSSLAVVGGLGLAAGQTAGKITLYEAARAGRNLATRQPRKPQRPTRFSRWSARLLAAMEGRLKSAAIILLSASVGIPPLLATAVGAGVLKMRRIDFIVMCFIGRAARFLVIMWPIAWATQ